MDVLGDTPVRHDEFSITKTSLRSRVLISANNRKHGKERKLKPKSRISQKEKEVLCSSVKSSDMSVRSPLLSDPSATFEVTSCEMPVDDSFSLEMSSIQTCGSSSQKCLENFRLDNMQLGTPVVANIQQVSSTPRPLKDPIKAVSSTPNLDAGNFSKLARNASTQTDFTSNGSHFEELHDELKSLCVPDDGCLRVIICDKIFSQNNGLVGSSPGNQCASKVVPFQKTPVQSKPSTIRKMSLRSKTMICSAYEKSKPTNFKRFNSMEEKRVFSNTYSLMPHHRTPPLSEKGIHNPFEKDLHERLGKTLFSPDVFSVVVSPSEESEYLRWTIEDISSINPVAIDEDFTLPSDDEDLEKEQKVQQEINRYFSETHRVLSPAENETTTSFSQVKDDKFRHRAAASTPNKCCPLSPKQLKNAITQTALSLPETLPHNLEDSLRSHFKLLEVEDLNLSASNLRRKLFFHSEDEPPSPVRFENNPSPLFKWKHSDSPCGAVNKKERHFTPVGKEALSSPEMSPVVSQQNTSKSNSSLNCKKNLHLLFPGAEYKEQEEEEYVIMDTTSFYMPNSQDTGYNTEPSWRQSTQISPALAKPPHLLASTPSQHNRHALQ